MSTKSDLENKVKSIVQEAIEIDWEHDNNLVPLPDRATKEIMELIDTHTQAEVERAKQELRDKFGIDANAKYDVKASDKVVVLEKKSE